MCATDSGNAAKSASAHHATSAQSCSNAYGPRGPELRTTVVVDLHVAPGCARAP